MKKYKYSILLTSILLVIFVIFLNRPKANYQEYNLVEVAGQDIISNPQQIHLCTELFPPPPPNMDILFKSDTNILFRDFEHNDTLVSFIYKYDSQKLAGIKEYYWHKTDLKVTFLDGDLLVQNRVIQSAKKWEEFCGIKFHFGSFSDADITISFLYQGSWSYIGSYSQKMKPSMNFGWLYRETPEEEYDRVVLHEFGHALGFIHEHQSPNGNIPWNAELVYKYYMGPPNFWDKRAVDENIFRKYSFDQVNATQFDPNSIMLYAIPAELTTNGYSTTTNSNLSQLDIKFVSTIYPK